MPFQLQQIDLNHLLFHLSLRFLTLQHLDLMLLLNHNNSKYLSLLLIRYLSRELAQDVSLNLLSHIGLSTIQITDSQYLTPLCEQLLDSLPLNTLDKSMWLVQKVNSMMKKYSQLSPTSTLNQNPRHSHQPSH